MDVREKLVEIVERASVRTLPKNTCHTNIVMLVNALIEEIGRASCRERV